VILSHYRICRQGAIDHGPRRRALRRCARVRSPTQAADEAPTPRAQDWHWLAARTAHEFRFRVAPGSRAGDLTARACGGARGFPAHGAAGRWWSPNLPGTRRRRPGTHTCAIRSRARSDGRLSLTGTAFARDLGALACLSSSYHHY